MNTVIPFDFEDFQVRAVMGEDGQPWFVGKDVCDALRHSNHNKALGRLPDDERRWVTIGYPPHGQRETVVINEPGVYRLIVTSRVPAAERFKRWLFHEVLPSLRRTGEYKMPRNSQHELRSSEETIPAAESDFKVRVDFSEYDFLLRNLAESRRLEVSNNSLKVEFARHLAHAYLTETAKSDEDISAILRGKGIDYCPPEWVAFRRRLAADKTSQPE